MSEVSGEWIGVRSDIVMAGILVWRPAFGARPVDAICLCGRPITYEIGDSCGHYGHLPIHTDDRTYTGGCHSATGGVQ